MKTNDFLLCTFDSDNETPKTTYVAKIFDIDNANSNFECELVDTMQRMKFQFNLSGTWPGTDVLDGTNYDIDTHFIYSPNSSSPVTDQVAVITFADNEQYLCFVESIDDNTNVQFYHYPYSRMSISFDDRITLSDWDQYPLGDRISSIEACILTDDAPSKKAKIFSKAAIDYFNGSFQNKVKHTKTGGCMRAVYIGLGALYGRHYDFKNDFFKSFWRSTRDLERKRGLKEGVLNTVDKLFRALEKEGITSAEQVFKPVSKSNGIGWIQSNGNRISNLEKEIYRQLEFLANGSYYFGISIKGGIHSLTIRVEKMNVNYQVYWMDQFSIGISSWRKGRLVSTPTPNVTGELDQELLVFGRSKATSIWLYLPDMAENVLVPFDSNGDGIYDDKVSAITEV